jgi:hypothetical protein
MRGRLEDFECAIPYQNLNFQSGKANAVVDIDIEDYRTNDRISIIPWVISVYPSVFSIDSLVDLQNL